MPLKLNRLVQKLGRLPFRGKDDRIRLAIVGNSHLAALKLAERDGLIEAEDFDICYYGGAGALFANMVFQDGLLDMKSKKNALLVTDGRYAALPVDAFDAFMFHGASYSYSALLRRYGGAGVSPNTVSSAFLLETARQSLYLPFIANNVAFAVREDVDVPVVISTNPLKAQRSRQFANTSVADTDIRKLDAALHTAFKEKGIHYIAQPADSIAGNVYTDDRFSIGSVRLKGDLTTQHDEEDFGHMNAEYGALVLRDALAKIRELVAQQHVKTDRRAEARKKRIEARERRMQE